MEQTGTVIPSASAGAVVQERAGWNIRRLPALLAVFTIALGLVYLAVLPPWSGPDEPRHYEYVRLLDEKNKLVSWADVEPSIMQEIIRSMDSVNYWKWGSSLWKRTAPGELPTDFSQIYLTSHQLHQPPVAYLLYLIPFKLAASSDINAQLFAMRLLSILLNVVVVLAAYAAGRELFADEPSMALALPVFIMLLPQHLFLHSTVMNDHLVEAAMAWMFVLLTRTFRLGLSLSRVLGIFVAVGIGLGAKRTALFAVPILGVAFLAYVLVHWRAGRLTAQQKSARLAVTVSLTALAAVILFVGWQWISANDPTLQDYIVRLFLFLPSQEFPFQLDARIISPAAFPLYAGYVKKTFLTTWGHFGWVNITLGVQAYWGFAALSVASLVGLVLFAVRDFRRLLMWQRATLIVYALSVVIAFVFVIALQVRFWDIGMAGDPQGRYLFPVLIPLAALFLLGLRAFFPRTRHMVWFGIVTGAMLLYNVIALVWFIIPFYRA